MGISLGGVEHAATAHAYCGKCPACLAWDTVAAAYEKQRGDPPARKLVVNFRGVEDVVEMATGSRRTADLDKAVIEELRELKRIVEQRPAKPAVREQVLFALDARIARLGG